MEKRKILQYPYNYICENRVKKAIVAVLNAPRTVSEITGDVIKRLDLKDKPKIGKTLKELEQRRIIRCLTLKLKNGEPGRVYGLTKKGIDIVRRIYREIGERFEYRKLNRINWYDYGWCMNGSQKKAIIKALLHPYR
ncbi:MAG: hypothetical protein V2A65_08925 [Candidatus Omnitrophota bacterium]